MGGTATPVGSRIVGERGGPEVHSVKPWASYHRAVRSSFDVTPGTPPVMAAATPRLVDAGGDVTVTYHAPGAAGERLVVVPSGGDPAGDALDAQATPGGQPVDVPEMVDAFVWVVTRHEVDYRAQLELGDDVEVRTWVDEAPRGPSWARFVEVYKAGAEKPSAQIKSNWVMLDAQTRRIKRVPRSSRRGLW